MPRQQTPQAKPPKSSVPSPPLTRQRYAALVTDVKRLAAATESSSARVKVDSFWGLGRRISREHLSAAHGYHNAVLRDLARDTEFNVRNLQYAVAFHRAYPKCPKQPLSWGHFRILLERVPAADRERYANLAVKDALNTRQLSQRITLDQPNAPSTSKLTRPTLPNYLYAAEVVHIVDGDTLDLRIDLGFHTERIGRFRLANINTPEVDTPDGRSARDFLFARLQPGITIAVQTQRTDLHGRYVTHLFYSSLELTTAECFTQGTYLNDELLQEGHAEVMLAG